MSEPCTQLEFSLPCPSCGYDLKGLPAEGHHCPECGTAYSFARISTAMSPRDARFRARLLLVESVLFLAWGLLGSVPYHIRGMPAWTAGPLVMLWYIQIWLFLMSLPLTSLLLAAVMVRCYRIILAEPGRERRRMLVPGVLWILLWSNVALYAYTWMTLRQRVTWLAD